MASEVIKMLNVVIGATGHLGNVLVRELVKTGEKVRVVALPNDDISPIKELNVEIVYGDVTDLPSIEEALSGANVVYHLASAVNISSGKRALLEKVNVGGTANVISASLKNHIDRLIYTSSVHAILEPPHGTIINETLPFVPDKVLGDYAKTKAKASLLVLDAVKKYGLDAVILCPSGIIGPYDYKVSEMGQLMLDFIEGRLKAYIDGAYDFADVRDVATGHILAAEKGKKGEYYILSGHRMTIEKLLMLLKKITGIKKPVHKMPYALALFTAPLTHIYYHFTKTKPLFTTYSIRVLASNSYISHDKATKELGYTVRPVENSLKDAYEWFAKHGYIKSKFLKAS
jgi:dihydroflavonol-4-reductase